MYRVPYLEEYPFRDEGHAYIHIYSNSDYVIWVHQDDGELTAHIALHRSEDLWRDIVYEGHIPDLMRVLWTYSSGPLV